MSSSLSTWSRALQIVLALLCGFATVVLGFAVVVITIDESDHTDSWDGFGTLIGLILGGFMMIVLAILVGLLLLTRSGRARRSRGRLVWAAGMSTVLAAAFLTWALWMLAEYIAQLDVLALVGLPALVLAVPAVGTLVAAAAAPETAAARGWPPA